MSKKLMRKGGVKNDKYKLTSFFELSGLKEKGS
jgi:hypothetical protein